MVFSQIVRRVRTAALCLGSYAALPVIPSVLPVQNARGTESRLRAPVLDSVLTLDSAVLHGVLPNGLHYYIRENRKPEKRASLHLIVKAGSLHEDEDQRGLAHFVEHMAFNGTTHFRKYELVNYLQSIGLRFGAHLNAFTAFDQTQYQIQVPTDDPRKLAQGFNILEDWAHGVTMDSVEIDAERNVIVEEWRLRDLGVMGRLSNKHLPVLMENSRYADRKPIGDMQIIRTAKREQLARFYADWYRPDLMAVVAVGDFDKKAVEQTIRKQFGAIRMPAKPRPAPTVTLTPRTTPQISIATDPELPNMSVAIMIREQPIVPSTMAAYRTLTIRRFLYAIMNDRLHELTTRPGVPFLGAAFTESGIARELVFRQVGIAVKDTQLLPSLEAVWTEIERAARHGITDAELERIKTSALRSIETTIREDANTRSDSYAASYTEHFLGTGTAQSLEDEVRLGREILASIRPVDLQRELQQWRSAGNQLISIDIPKLERMPFPDTAQLLRQVLASFERISRQELAAYTDVVGDEPLIETPPVPGTVVSERARGAGVTEWTLSNGARVLLKPTTFKTDEVVFYAKSPGGYQIVADSDLVSAQMMSEFVGVGGVGKYSMTELRKRIARYVFTLRGSVGDGSEQFSGTTTLRDLDVFFQFVYLGFTARRYDSVAMQAQLENLKAALANRDLNPGAALQDTMAAVLAGYHPRIRPVTAAMMDSVNLRRAFDLYNARFANAADFTFVIVGNFHPDSLRPLITRYIASLPATTQRESVPKLGTISPTGIVRKTVRKGLDAQAYTLLVLHGKAPITLDVSADMVFLQSLLQMRLTRRLREELGGVYSVGVGTTVQPIHSTFSTTINFVSDPNRADEMTAAALAVIDSLRKFGPTEEEVRTVREQTLQGSESTLKENGYWAAALHLFDESGWSFDQLLSDERTKRLTKAYLHRAVQKYLALDNYLRFELLPEE